MSYVVICLCFSHLQWLIIVNGSAVHSPTLQCSGRVYCISRVISDNGRSWQGALGELEIFSPGLWSTQIEKKPYTEYLFSSVYHGFPVFYLFHY